MKHLERLLLSLWVRLREIEGEHSAHSPKQQLALWQWHIGYRLTVTAWALLYGLCARLGIDV